MDHFIATGTGRSGTQWISDVLNQILPGRVSHEQVFNSQADYTNNINWKEYIGDVSYSSAAWAGRLPTRYPVLHLTRNPIDTAISWAQIKVLEWNMPEPQYDEDENEIPYIPTPDDIENMFRMKYTPSVNLRADNAGRAIRHVREWTMLCENFMKEGHPYMRVKLEELDASKMRDVVRFLTHYDVETSSLQEVMDRVKIRNKAEVAVAAPMKKEQAAQLIHNDPEFDILSWTAQYLGY